MKIKKRSIELKLDKKRKIFSPTDERFRTVCRFQDVLIKIVSAAAAAFPCRVRFFCLIEAGQIHFTQTVDG